MNERWEGIAPAPAVYSQLDIEELTILAHLAWSCATHRPVRLADLADLPDRDGHRIGDDAADIIDSLMSMKICSVRGHRHRGRDDGRPMTILLGGFISRTPGNTPQVPRTPGSRYRPRNDAVLVETGLYATERSPRHIVERLLALKELATSTEASARKGDSGDIKLKRADTMATIATERAELFARWATAEPTGQIKALAARKAEAAQELKRQADNIRSRIAATTG